MEFVLMLLAPSAVVLLAGAIRAVIVGRAERRSNQHNAAGLVGSQLREAPRNRA